LVESTNIDHLANNIINACLPHANKSIRIGITGFQVGNTLKLLENILPLGKKVAVLAVDPSTISHGSILGDKKLNGRIG
jgi:LAO/AO transport system kinase